MNLGSQYELGFTHYRCLAHVIHLGVTSALEKLKIMIREVKEFVIALRRSGKRTERLNDVQRKLIEKMN